MHPHRLRASALFALILVVAACSESPEPLAGPGNLEPLTTPAGAGSSAPNLTVGLDGRVFLSWVEPAPGDTHRLRFSTLEDDGWSEPRTIAEGPGWFVNWADFPSMVVLADGRLAGHYLQRPTSAPGGTYAYHIRIVQSSDGGITWSEPVTPHADGALVEHGFVSLFAARGDSIGAVWLDGRAFDPAFGATGEMSLRTVSIGADGGLGSEQVIDDRACECCQTSVTLTTEGPLVAYRDRAEAEIRDVHVARQAQGRWGVGMPVHEDGWTIDACPVNGPSAASDGSTDVAVAWFTGARDSARVAVSFSDDAGGTFGPAIPVDDGSPLGRVSAAMLTDGSALVSWLEGGDGGQARLLVRRILNDGSRSAALLVAASHGGRSSGVPRMVLSGEVVVFAWTEPSDPTRVLTARAWIGGTRGRGGDSLE